MPKKIVVSSAVADTMVRDYSGGATAQQIADRLSTTLYVVLRTLRERGCEIRPAGRKPNKHRVPARKAGLSRQRLNGYRKAFRAAVEDIKTSLDVDEWVAKSLLTDKW